MTAPLLEPTAARQPFDWKWLALPVLLYILSIAFTQPPFIGDTPLYMGQIATAHDFTAPALWEFGHILWRPLGFLLSPLFLALTPDSIAFTRELKIAFGLISLNIVSGLISTVLMFDLSRRFMSRPILATLPVLVFVWSDSFLSYSHSGVSYVPALTALLAGIWVQLTAPRVEPKMLWASSCLFGIACLLWFPFVFVVPAAACGRKLAGLRESDWDWSRVFATLVISGAVVTVGVGAAAFMAGVRSFSEFNTWRNAASHDWDQNRQLIRAISGCPRLLIDLGRDGTYLKRFTFKDPYNPVSAAAILRLTLWKIIFFYLFVASIALLAWTSRRARPTLALAALAGVPLLVFAVFLFEPSSPERFLPGLPFLLLAMAAGWDSPAGSAKWLRGIVLLFLLALPIMNWPSFGTSSHSLGAHARLADLRQSAGPDDVLVTINLQDPVIQLIDQDLFDPANRPKPLRNKWLINPAAGNVALWRQNFAAFVLANWRENRDVWVTKSALRDRPEESSYWVEGDNPAVHWKDIESFFKTISFDRSTARPDGFLRISRSTELQNRLTQVSGELVEQR
jgi:hypothetical protein